MIFASISVIVTPSRIETHRGGTLPIDSLVLLLTPAEGQMPPEVGLVGREGMLGIPLVLGIRASPVQARAQGTGMALRMTAAHFRGEHASAGSLRSRLNREIHDRIVKITQTAACNRFHLAEGCLARWLPMMRDRGLVFRFIAASSAVRAGPIH